ncbi:DUF3445 domain-containing protein [Rhodobacterales bacterium HKCCE3408]|nr:DUF3445 domain-containing protein [Rhodobacterales bacterium HKCCE3408]
MDPIVNPPPAVAPWTQPRFSAIPGTAPVGGDDWIAVAPTYAAQMAQRRWLIAERWPEVVGVEPGSDAALAELYAMLLDLLGRRADFEIADNVVRCPDGVEIALDPAHPLETMGMLVQEDLCLMELRGEEYALTAAVLCFPLGWMLSEKIGRPMTGIHKPVARYDDMAARRVGRLFDGLQPGRPICRENGVFRDNGVLFQPETEAVHHAERPKHGRTYYRSERQCLVRLPLTRAVLFTIHTRQWRVSELPEPPP